MNKHENLLAFLESEFAGLVFETRFSHEEITTHCKVDDISGVLTRLKTAAHFAFDQLIDICAVDYLHYGIPEWETETASEQGFSRAVDYQLEKTASVNPHRFAVVYHLLSTKLNHRIRIKSWLDETTPQIPTACNIWKAANWFEREAYDLYGILFTGHPDMRRLLTDYGFIGHPFRKDFPLSGTVEMRYDATEKKVIYDPVKIVPRITVPKVIRQDNRYCSKAVKSHD